MGLIHHKSAVHTNALSETSKGKHGKKLMNFQCHKSQDTHARAPQNLFTVPAGREIYQPPHNRQAI